MTETYSFNAEELDIINKIQKYDINDRMKASLLLLILGFKPNITFEYYNLGHYDKFKIYLRMWNIKSVIIERDGMNKLVLGKFNNDLKEIRKLDEIMYEETPDSTMSRYNRVHNRFGQLMGYPGCCCIPSIKLKKNIHNSIGWHFHSNNPWPLELSYFDGLIYHFPCSPKCTDSIKIGRKVSLVRSLVEGRLLKDIKHNAAGYVLHFGTNLYIVFKGKAYDKNIRISRIMNKQLDWKIEGTDLHKKLEIQKDFLKKIQIGDLITVNDNNIITKNEKKELVYKKMDISDGVLIQYR
ncbi:MAG: hypothetical protein KKF44_09810 [Nanoarchaeota archaeon]|nr:hypothetical protein [Nanoarchaeota archaeon]